MKIECGKICRSGLKGLLKHLRFRHISCAYMQVPQKAAQLSNVGQHFVDGTHVRTRHDFEQWHARAIEVDKRETIVHVVQIFARILSSQEFKAEGNRVANSKCE